MSIHHFSNVVCIFFTEGPDCGYHIYRLIKGLSELDTSLALAAPCPGVRNIRLISFRLRPEPGDQTPGGAMSVKSEQSHCLILQLFVSKNNNRPKKLIKM